MTERNIKSITEQDLRGIVKNAGAGNEVAIAEVESRGINIDQHLAEQALDGDEIAWRLLIQRYSE